MDHGDRGFRIDVGNICIAVMGNKKKLDVIFSKYNLKKVRYLNKIC